MLTLENNLIFLYQFPKVKMELSVLLVSSKILEVPIFQNFKILVMISAFLITDLLMLYLMFFFGSCYFLSLSLDIPLSFLKIAIFITFANILSFLPISFAGIGTREACLVHLFSLESLSHESALAFSILVFTFTYALLGIIGFFCFMAMNKNEKQISV